MSVAGNGKEDAKRPDVRRLLSRRFGRLEVGRGKRPLAFALRSGFPRRYGVQRNPFGWVLRLGRKRLTVGHYVFRLEQRRARPDGASRPIPKEAGS